MSGGVQVSDDGAHPDQIIAGAEGSSWWGSIPTGETSHAEMRHAEGESCEVHVTDGEPGPSAKRRFHEAGDSTKAAAEVEDVRWRLACQLRSGSVHGFQRRDSYLEVVLGR